MSLQSQNNFEPAISRDPASARFVLTDAGLNDVGRDIGPNKTPELLLGEVKFFPGLSNGFADNSSIHDGKHSIKHIFVSSMNILDPEKIRARFRKLKKSQDEFAKSQGLTQSTISRKIAGTFDWTVSQFDALCKYLECTREELYSDQPKDGAGTQDEGIKSMRDEIRKLTKEVAALEYRLSQVEQTIKENFLPGLPTGKPTRRERPTGRR